MHPALQSKLDTLQQAIRTRKQVGKSVSSQLREIVSLRFGPGKLRPNEYYSYHLYEDNHFAQREKKRFIGHQVNHRMDRRLNHPEWRALTDNKLLTFGFLKGLGLPTPEVYAVYHPAGRDVGTVRCCRTPEEMKRFLRTEMRYPFFAKALAFNVGIGTSAVRSLDREQDRLQLGDGTEPTVSEYVNGLVPLSPEIRKVGYIFQEQIVQHPEIERICGRTAATLRMVVLLHDDGPRLVRVFWRIPVGTSMIDNFSKGKRGNLVASVNRETGVVERVAEAEISPGSTIDRHPDTAEPFIGFAIPHWAACVKLCLDAASTLPGLRYQHWDVAIGPEGPIFVEVNYEGGCVAAQTAGARGLLDDELGTFLTRYGTEFKLTK